MAEFSDFYKDVVAQLPGAPLVMVDYALLQTAIDFCETSLILQVNADPISLRPNVPEYEIAVDDDQLLVAQIMEAKIDGRRLPAVALDLRNTTIWPSQTYEWGDSEVDDPMSIRILGTPEEPATLTLRVALKPKQDASSLPDDLYKHHRVAIGYGAMARMMLQPGKTWSNTPLGSYREKEYAAFRNQAQVDANKGQTRADLRVRPRPFA